MTYNHLNESEDEQTISKEDLEALISALGHTSINNDAALQPTVKALEKLASEQEAAQGRIIRLEKAINLLSLEVEYLKERDSEHNGWLKNRLHWKWGTGFAVVTILAIAASAVLQNMALSNLEKVITKQQEIIFNKVKELDKKTKR